MSYPLSRLCFLYVMTREHDDGPLTRVIAHRCCRELKQYLFSPRNPQCHATFFFSSHVTTRCRPDLFVVRTLTEFIGPQMGNAFSLGNCEDETSETFATGEYLSDQYFSYNQVIARRD